jgi:hypothetical protein
MRSDAEGVSDGGEFMQGHIANARGIKTLRLRQQQRLQGVRLYVFIGWAEGTISGSRARQRRVSGMA